MTTALVGTGVELRLVANPERWIAEVGESDRLAGRALKKAHDKGELVLVETQVFVETEDADGICRLPGAVMGADEPSRSAEPISRRPALTASGGSPGRTPSAARASGAARPASASLRACG